MKYSAEWTEQTLVLTGKPLFFYENIWLFNNL